MLIPILTALGMLTMQEPPADSEAAMMSDLRARALVRCESDRRVEGETVEACAERRIAALIGTYGTTSRALSATAGWIQTGETSGPSLDFPTIDEVMADQARARRSTAAPDRQPYQPPQPRCRRESTRSEDGTSASTTVVCGNGGDAERAAREMLDRLSQPQN